MSSAVLPAFAHHPYAAFLHEVEKPARYTGGEVGSRKKDWASVEATVCLAFPDVYDIGMSHLGFKILYAILNDDARTLGERAYAPWPDMEKQLRTRGIPLVSQESARKLSDFDVVGFSLQFELTYTNVLNMLELGGIPLRSSDRGEDDPLVLGGGPTATHPEPVAPFFDALVIGDGEEALTNIALAWKRLRNAGVSRQERLHEIAKMGGVYVPSLYEVAFDAASERQVVVKPKHDDIPKRIERAFIADLNRYPFPAESPIGGPEAVFDRMSIEIARGCTEGCRFCQAGNIYRPVRERDPQQIVDTVVAAVKASGQDEVSLTALSTADASCISPLIKKVVEKLTPERVSLGVSSLRAYGLSEDLLDDMRQVRATGLTFAPEAGTQRMRDVVNKNVTEEQLLETADRTFKKGWDRMKLYFMIGLPTEEDVDVRGIVATGLRALEKARNSGRGKAARGRASVTVSVSTHVPKPHTPFQWCAMDTLEEVKRKQYILRDAARGTKIDLKTHEAKESVLEGVLARGDRRLADAIEHAFKNGARFDSWEEHIRHDVWAQAFSAFEIDLRPYLGTLPVTARLPWDHIDVGLEDGFLVSEYRKALQSRLSPPCGKAAGMFIHHTNIAEAKADARRLVCYDCGVACDMTKMRDERLEFLEKMGAFEPPKVSAKSLPLLDEERPPPAPGTGHGVQIQAHRIRITFQKLGPTAFLGHLDLVRALPRVLRRLAIPMAYSQGFHPKPDLTFSPALSLGVPSLDEHVDIKVLELPDMETLVSRLNSVAPEGLVFTNARPLGNQDPAIGKMISGAKWALAFARSALPEGEAGLRAGVAAALAATTLPLTRTIEGISKVVDVARYLVSADVESQAAKDALITAGLVGDLVVVEIETLITGSGTVKAAEVAECFAPGVPHRAVRMALLLDAPKAAAIAAQQALAQNALDSAGAAPGPAGAPDTPGPAGAPDTPDA